MTIHHLPGAYVGPRELLAHVSPALDETILAGWRRGCDTAFMAGVLCVPESHLANRLAWLRDRAAS